jgi:hypothetical protein
MRRWLAEFVAALASEPPNGPLCAGEGCVVPVRQRGARCPEHRAIWDRERRRLAERERRRLARLVREGATRCAHCGRNVAFDVPVGWLCARCQPTGPVAPHMVVVNPNLEPQRAPPVARTWRAGR